MLDLQECASYLSRLFTLWLSVNEMKQQAVAVQIYIKASFTLSEESSLSPGLNKEAMDYLSGRQSSVECHGCTSKLSKIKQGVPQGVVLRPFLFNFHISRLLTPPEGF